MSTSPTDTTMNDTTMADSEWGVARNINALRDQVDAWRAIGLKIALVPTMGALHEGHLSLIEHGLDVADRVVASIFVNPTQFAAHEDLDTYPRQETRDFDLLKAAGCHLAFAPSAEEMYPQGAQTAVTVTELSQGLCGASRPHFFGGVATIVCKLLNQCRPDVAIFGEKDFQQLLIIKQMARDLDMPVEIVGAPIVRETDGLAMSSRNAYLSPEHRSLAPMLNRVMTEVASAIANGAAAQAALADGAQQLTAAGFNVDYFEARSALDLTPAQDASSGAPLRLFAAAMLGQTRLIDNIPVQ